LSYLEQRIAQVTPDYKGGLGYVFG